jgi:ribosome-associated heat shock protein Hsp15
VPGRSEASDAEAGTGAVRVDKWLWSVRLYKTRSAATEACRAGHVRVNQANAKPATPLRPGDTVTARVEDRERIVEVVRLIEKRVGAPVAAECYVDHSPPPPEDHGPGMVNFARDRGMGRPTKRDRRQLDQLRRH